MLDLTTITLESDVKNITEIESVLKKFGTVYSSIERTLFNKIKDKDNATDLFNDLQREFISKYNIHARLFKSIWKKVIGRIQSIKSNRKNYEILAEKKIEKLSKELKKCKRKRKTFRMKSKINKLEMKLKNERKIQSIWGSKNFYRKQWLAEHNEWKKEWKIRRDNNIFIIGSSDETFGNSLCQLQNLNKLRITLPKDFEQKHLDIIIDFNKDKKLYKYLPLAIANGQALTHRVFQNPESKKWYVQTSFTLSNECKNLNNGTIGIDINYNTIATCIIKKDGNKEYFKNYNFNIDKENQDKNRQIFSDIVNQIVDNALENRKTITIEEINLKNVLKNEKISLVCYNAFISLLRTRCVKKGILLIEINPKYTSIIGGLKYQKRLGVSRHGSASYVIGRRGLNYIEKIPIGYICLLQGEEKDKSLLERWGFINKRLQKVSQGEKSLYLHSVYRDQSNCSLESYSVSFANE